MSTIVHYGLFFENIPTNLRGPSYYLQANYSLMIALPILIARSKVSSYVQDYSFSVTLSPSLFLTIHPKHFCLAKSLKVFLQISLMVKSPSQGVSSNFSLNCGNLQTGVSPYFFWVTGTAYQSVGAVAPIKDW